MLFTPSAEAAHNRLGNEVVILHLKSGTYFGLDKIGARVWAGLVADRLPSEVCEEIVGEFGIDRARVEKDLHAFLEDLIEHDLVVSGKS